MRSLTYKKLIWNSSWYKQHNPAALPLWPEDSTGPLSVEDLPWIKDSKKPKAQGWRQMLNWLRGE